jgi:hypothetical protein
MAGSTLNNGHTQRKTLATQLDRLDVILDGLADALNESVAFAVRDVVGQVVKEAVETTIREVLGNQDLLQASLAMHAPPAQIASVPRSSPIRTAIGGALSLLVQRSAEIAGKIKQTFVSAWSRSLEKIGDLVALARFGWQWIIGGLWATGSMIRAGMNWSWRYRKSSGIAVGVGVLSGVGVYYAGPLVAAISNGLNSAALTLFTMVLLPLWRLISGSRAEKA